MRFQGTFDDIHDNPHTLTIGTSGEITPLTFGESPFTSSMDESDSTIYKPVKCQAGTIGLVATGANYLFGLYTGDAHGNPVTLTDKNGVVEWTGFITPSLYDIGYNAYREEFSVDCLDGLSTLQYYKYTPIGTVADTHRLLDIVVHCLKKCGCYSTANIAAPLRRGASSVNSVWEDCYLSERNFLTKDLADTDGKDTMTYLEVLEHICQWVGVSVMAHGDTIHIIDYDYLASNSAQHIIFDLIEDTYTKTTLAPQGYTINGSSYAAGGTHLSLDNVYNKVTVTDEANDLDKLVVDFFQDAVNITKSDSGIEHVVPSNPKVTGEFVDNTPNGGEKMLAFIDVPGGASAEGTTKWNVVFLKLYKSPYHKLYRYNSSWVETAAADDEANFTTMKELNGAFLVRAGVMKLDNTQFIKDWVFGRWTPGYQGFGLDDALALNEISNVSFTDYIFLTNHTPNVNRDNSTAGDYPYFRTSANVDLGTFFGGKNAFLIISGQYTWHDQDADPYPVPENEIDVGRGSDPITPADAHLLCRLQWGTRYWNGTAWTTTPSNFNLPLEVEAKRNDECIYRVRRIANTVTWRNGTNEQGYLIPMPTDNSLRTGAPVLTVYRPLDFSYYKCKFMALQGFGMKPVVGDPSFCGEPDTDTSYTNVIDDSFANTLDEIALKVCTYDDKKPTLNAVAWYNGSDYYYIDTCWHDALSPAEASQGVERYDGTISDGNMRSEEHLIYRLVRQYSNPAKVLNITLSADLSPRTIITESNINLNGIIDKVDVDYRRQEFTYKTIAK